MGELLDHAEILKSGDGGVGGVVTHLVPALDCRGADHREPDEVLPNLNSETSYLLGAKVGDDVLNRCLG